jgi:hypothetical protein
LKMEEDGRGEGLAWFNLKYLQPEFKVTNAGPGSNRQ